MLPCLWTSYYSDLSPEDALRRIAAVGFPAVGLSTEHLAVIREAPYTMQRGSHVRKLVQELGLRMDQAHLYLQADIAQLDTERRLADQAIVRQEIEIVGDLGVKAAVLHAGMPGQVPSLQDGDRVHKNRIEALRSLAAVADKSGVRLALENGGRVLGPHGEVLEDGSVRGLRDALAALGLGALGICLDTGHAILEGWDVAEAARVAGDMLIALHIADNDGSGDQHRLPYCYGSQVDWRGVMQALAQIGYQGPFNLEIPGERARPLDIRDVTARYALALCNELMAG